MKILTDVTPTADTDCVFRNGHAYCDATGKITRCGPIFYSGSKCPYCIGAKDFYKEVVLTLAENIKDEEE